jgi:hypothetical protein
MAVQQVEAFRVSVEFEITAAFTGLMDYPRHIHVVGFALFQQSPAGVCQHSFLIKSLLTYCKM